MENRIEQHP
ncbi:unnamed protein product [Lathyrus oleraceus]